MQRLWRVYRKVSRIGWAVVYCAALVVPAASQHTVTGNAFCITTVAAATWAVAKHLRGR